MLFTFEKFENISLLLFSVCRFFFFLFILLVFHTVGALMTINNEVFSVQKMKFVDVRESYRTSTGLVRSEE